jgi:hypothetical protein
MKMLGKDKAGPEGLREAVRGSRALRQARTTLDSGGTFCLSVVPA